MLSPCHRSKLSPCLWEDEPFLHVGRRVPWRAHRSPKLLQGGWTPPAVVPPKAWAPLRRPSRHDSLPPEARARRGSLSLGGSCAAVGGRASPAAVPPEALTPATTRSAWVPPTRDGGRGSVSKEGWEGAHERGRRWQEGRGNVGREGSYGQHAARFEA